MPDGVYSPVSEIHIAIPATREVPGRTRWAQRVSYKCRRSQKRIGPTSENAISRIRARPKLSAYANSEYEYVTAPTAVALFWAHGGRGNVDPTPLRAVFEIPPHALDTAAVSNYFVRKTGDGLAATQWLKDMRRYRLLATGVGLPTGPIHEGPRAGAKKALPFSAPLALSALRFANIPRRASQGRGDLPFTGNLLWGRTRKGAESADLLSASV